jgi:hypothetical protein
MFKPRKLAADTKIPANATATPIEAIHAIRLLRNA